MERILIVEDDPDISDNVKSFLSAINPPIDCTVCHDGITAFTLLASDASISLAVVDIGLPELDGLSLTARLRSIGWTGPVIMLTARDTVEDRIRGLEAGADDYLIKPFSLAELAARIRAQLRRNDMISPKKVLKVEDLVLDTNSLVATRAGTELKLNATMTKMLTLLMQKSPGVVSKKDFENEVWDGAPVSPETIRTHLYMLRSVVDKPFDTPLIRTVPGMGWSIRNN